MVSKSDKHWESIGAKGWEIWRDLKNFDGRIAKKVTWKDTRWWLENGMLKPEILKGEQLLPNLSLCPTKSIIRN